MIQALLVVAPPSMRPTLISSIEDEGARNPPSDTTVRRAELAMDVSIMLDQREHYPGERVHRFLWCDASPVAGFDWLWSQYREVRHHRLVETVRAMHKLSASVRASVPDSVHGDGMDEEPPLDPSPDWVGCLRTISANVR